MKKIIVRRRISRWQHPLAVWMIAFAWAISGFRLSAQDSFELPPIRYSTTEATDPVAQLQRKMASGEVVLERDEHFGYLPGLLRALDVPVSSQVLVFSKTSLQIHKISPANPRAIYFNDSVYIGYVPGSEILELAANDATLGAVFYTLDGSGGSPELDSDDEPTIETLVSPILSRDRGQCLSCHATSRTENVPGYLIRSVYPDRSGRPRTGSSSYTTDYRSPWSQRWGGWYVTGQHGTMRHMGNSFAVDREDPQKLDVESGANLLELPQRVRTGLHPLPTSDLVALLVLEHQARVHNLITRANFETRQAIALDETMNAALGRPPTYRSESTQRRIASASQALLDALMMVSEPLLESEIQGMGSFQKDFEARGPKTPDGLSLRELDLQTRLFRWPLSFLIYTPEFQSLPAEILVSIRRRIGEELRGALGEGVASSARWSAEERETIRKILVATLPDWVDV